MPSPSTRAGRTPAAVLALALALAAAACSANPAAPAAARPRHPVTSEEALATFDAAWTTVRDQHFDPALGGVDWDAVRDELRPRAATATDRSEVRAVVSEMLERLGQSHFALLPDDDEEEEAAAPGSGAEGDAAAAGGATGAEPAASEGEHAVEAGPGIDVRLRDERLLVTAVAADSPAWAAGVRAGWVLTRVGDRDVADLADRLAEHLADRDPRYSAFVAREAALSRLYGPVGTELSMRFLDATDAKRRIEVERARRDVLVSRFGNLPTMHLTFHQEIIEREGRSIGVIHFTNWFLPVVRPIDEAVDAMRGCDGIVLDLRGNGGGALAMVMGIAGHFLDEPRELGTHVTRTETLTYRANPRLTNAAGELVDPFAGPLAILIDETSASASEVFAGAMQSIGRARVFGEPSLGAVLPARTTGLPGGDVLLHAIADFKTPDGTRLEGRGVLPDEPVPVEREALLAGRDAQLEAALRWIATRTDS